MHKSDVFQVDFELENSTYRPQVYACKTEDDFPDEMRGLSGLKIVNTLRSQVAEWIKIKNPTTTFDAATMRNKVEDWLQNPENDCGNWVYYPWLNTVVRLLSAENFTTLRTSRNQYKITPNEQEILMTKTIGVVGLSVGQAAALTLAMERTGGTLRLADFDTLDLSNLNRLRAGLHQLGLAKTVIAAREIAQLDPYIRVELFPEGITPDNLTTFVSGLDLIVEECDSLPIKVGIRKAASAMGIPVIMDTSDRGMVDVERFDIERDRPILHGKMDAFEGKEPSEFTAEDRRNLLFALVDYEKASDRAKESYAEIGKSITTWPQLASAVALGGALMADTARRILLGDEVVSGRYYVDIEELIG